MSLVDDLNALIQTRVRQALATVEARGGLAGQRGTSSFTEPEAAGTAGIASPLTETEITNEDGSKSTSRTYYEEVSRLYSNDFVLSVEVKALKSITMRDANQSPVVLQFKAPIPKKKEEG